MARVIYQDIKIQKNNFMLNITNTLCTNKIRPAAR